MKVADNIIQLGEYQDSYLRRVLFPVNVRMLKTNPKYKQMIKQILKYMEHVVLQDYSDYGKVTGLSGANIGVPFNIISIFCNNGVVHFINPYITSTSKEYKTLYSNCGSLNLSKKIPVKRWEWVNMTYCNIDGTEYSNRFYLSDRGGTIQHEIEHNNGTLITDKEIYDEDLKTI